jgi:predicted chitinase
MSAIDPTNNTGLIIDDFINYAISHLSTIGGTINTVSLYPPLQTPGPAVIIWQGYTVAPAIPSVSVIEPEMEVQTELEAFEQTEIQNEILTEEVVYANEVLDEGNLPNEEYEVVEAYIDNTEEVIENLELKLEANLEIRYEQNKKRPKAAKITGKQQKVNLDLIEKALIKIGITNTAIITAVKANAMKESQATPIDENMNYSGNSIADVRRIFTKRAGKYTDAQLTEIKKNEVAMGDLMYGPESGKVGKWLGNDVKGDGFKYRGRGFIQVTGKGNYSACSLALYKDARLVKTPDLLLNAQTAADSTAWFINRSLKTFSKSMGIGLTNPTQANANLLVTSIIAGSPIKRGGSGFLASLVVLVDDYSTQV